MKLSDKALRRIAQRYDGVLDSFYYDVRDLVLGDTEIAEYIINSGNPVEAIDKISIVFDALIEELRNSYY